MRGSLSHTSVKAGTARMLGCQGPRLGASGAPPPTGRLAAGSGLWRPEADPVPNPTRAPRPGCPSPGLLERPASGAMRPGVNPTPDPIPVARALASQRLGLLERPTSAASSGASADMVSESPM